MIDTNTGNLMSGGRYLFDTFEAAQDYKNRVTNDFPFETGEHGAPSLWPHSPPFPQPFSGDSVCEVSRGENSVNSPTDCTTKCGNGVKDAGETTANCPSDRRNPQ